MIQIEKIEIQYFRSIYSETIKNLKDLSVFSGKNDCGKSNILRSLNLFFNNQTDWNEKLVFEKDFCRKRLIECRTVKKSKQFIKIKVHFIRGSRFRSLPKKFWVSKTWTRDSSEPTERNSLNDKNINAKSLDRAMASLQKYLKKIVFWYVPAVKERSFFNYSLGLLKEAIFASKKSEDFGGIVEGFNSTVRKESANLSAEFKDVSGIDIDIHLPENMEQLFRVFSVSTGSNNDFPLNVRGDGIQARFLPSLLYHVSKYSKRIFIWGFEEPENCIEHGLTTSLADEMKLQYSKESQIFITSHSPAFVGLESKNISNFRVYRNEHTKVIPCTSDNPELQYDLGLIELQRKYQQDLKQELETIKDTKKILQDSYDNTKKPLLLVEGKTDVFYLEEAWKRLRSGNQKPFKIKSCDISDGNEGKEKAGCGILVKALLSARTDQPKTIGLFDYDAEGKKAFKLDNNFSESNISADVKFSSNGHVAAIILPMISCRQDYYQHDNFPIEFFFSDISLNKKIANKGLRFKQPKITTQVNGKKIDEKTSTELHHRIITKGKPYFAENIVNTFTNEEFSEFEILLTLIENTLAELN